MDIASASAPGRLSGPTETRPSPAALAGALRRRLDEHPRAIVGALEHTGRMLDWPEAIALGPGHELEERSLLDLVVDDDRMVLTQAFLSCLDHGVAVTRGRLAATPDEPLVVSYFDLRAELGCCVRVCVPEDGAPVAATLRQLEGGPPRLAIITKGPNSEILAVDAAFTAMLGWSADEVVGRRTLELIHPDDQPRAVDNWMRMVLTGGQQVVRLRYARRDGSWLWTDTSNDLRSDAEGAATVSCQLLDVSAEMAATEALRHREQLLRRLTEAVPVGLLHLAADGSVTYANGQLQRLLGTGPIERIEDLGAVLDPDTRRQVRSALDRVLATGDDCDLEVTTAETATRPALRCRVTLSAIVDSGAVLGVLLCVVDVTELSTKARTDPLTGVLNRASVVEHLRSALGADGRRVGVGFVDLDRFKAVNDRYGHTVGDRVLCRVAAILSGAVRSGDHVGRLGGDEFLVVCPDVTDPADLAVLEQRIHAGLGAEGEGPGIGASVGFVLAVGGTRSAEAVIAEADAAMYRVKRG